MGTQCQFEKNGRLRSLERNRFREPELGNAMVFNATDDLTDDELRKKIESDVGDVRSKIMDEQEFKVYEAHSTRLAEAMKDDLRLLVDEFTSEKRSVLSAESDLESAVRRNRLLNVALIAFLVPTAYVAVSLPFRFKGHARFFPLTPVFHTPSSVVVTDAILIALSAVLFGLRTIVTPGRQTLIERREELRKREQSYCARLRLSTSEQLRLLITKLGLCHKVKPQFKYTPALAELDRPEVMQTSAVKKVENFVRSNKASALGIAARRGAGKTIILRYLTSPSSRLTSAGHRSVGVCVSAPVRYEANELLLRIFEQLAKEYLGNNWESRRSPSSNMVRLMLVGISSCVGVGLFVLGVLHYRFHVDKLEWLGAAWIMLSFAAFMYTAVALGARHPSQESEILQAQRVLEGLRWQRQHTVTESVGSSPASGLLNVGRQRSVTLSQRDIGRPRLVEDYRNFVQKIVDNDCVDRVVIAIDELDKLPTIDDATAVITELKDILHIGGTHVLVSVSEDALDQFIARGMARIDAFDSSFDEIIEISQLSPKEAVEILQRRAIGFPYEWALVCYALSGGLIRDLLRYARRCVDLYNEEGIHDSAPLLRRLISAAAAERVMSVLRAQRILPRLTEQGQIELHAALRDKDIGRLTLLHRFVAAVGDHGEFPLLQWLEWMRNVAERLIDNYPSDQELAREIARELARRGMELGRP